MVNASSHILAGSQAYPCSYAQKAIGLLPQRWQEVAMKVHRFLESSFFIHIMPIFFMPPLLLLSSFSAGLFISYNVVAISSFALFAVGLYLGQEMYNPLYPLTENIRDKVAKWSFVDSLWITTALCVACFVTKLPIFIIPVLPLMFVESLNTGKRFAEKGKASIIDTLKDLAEGKKKAGDHQQVELLQSLIAELSQSKVTKEVFFKIIYQFFQAHPSDYPPSRLYLILHSIHFQRGYYEDTDIIYLQGQKKHAIPIGCATTLSLTLRNLIEDLGLAEAKDSVIPLDYPKDRKKAHIKDLFIRFLATEPLESKEITKENVYDLLDMAHYYHFEWLEQECSEFIEKHLLNSENVCEMLRKAHQCHYLTLLDRIVFYIWDHADELLKNDSVKEGLKPFQNTIGAIYYQLNKESMQNWSFGYIEKGWNTILWTIKSSTDFSRLEYESLTDEKFQHLLSMLKHRRPDGNLPISLELKGFKFEAGQLEQLFALSDVTFLDIINCRIDTFTEEMGRQLGTNKSLKNLGMHLSNCDRSGNVHIRMAIEQNETLNSLRIKHVGLFSGLFGEEFIDLELFSSSKSIKNISIYEWSFHRNNSTLLANPVLESLHIISHEMNLEEFLPFCKDLAANRTLKELSLTSLNLNDCVIPLLEAVKQHPSLKKITLKSTVDTLSFNEDLLKRFKAETPNIQWINSYDETSQYNAFAI